jgi:hypothetical protein
MKIMNVRQKNYLNKNNMTDNFEFRAFDKINKSYLKISSLNFDDSGLVQLSGITKTGKLIHIPISEVELNITSDEIAGINYRLNNGRDYLMQIEADKITVEDALEAFGFGRNGLRG